MAVASGKTILQSDLAALATSANAKTSLSFLTNPCYQDPNTGASIGYGQYATICIASRGTGYKPEDLVWLGAQYDPPPAVAQYRVMLVDGNGGVLALRVISNGQIAPQNNSSPYWNQPSGPLALNGGSGSGATVTCSIMQYGPTAPYNFAAWNQQAGIVTGLYLISGGSGYAVNDQISIPTITGFAEPLTLQVTGVQAGTGAITAWSTVNTAYYNTTLANVPPAPLATTVVSSAHGSGATFGPYVLMSPNPGWGAELTRLRLDMQTPSFQGDLSGPWPITGFTNNTVYNSGNVEFYYPDNGSPQSVTLGSPWNTQAGEVGPMGTNGMADEYIAAYLYDLANNTDTQNGPFNKLTWEIVIGGTQDVTLNGKFQINAVNGNNNSAITVTTNIPGLVFTQTPNGSLAGSTTVGTVTNQTVAPGTYQIQATCSDSEGLQPQIAIYTINSNTMLIALVATGGVAVPGIDGTTDVLAITCAQINPTSGLGFGFWTKQFGPPPTSPAEVIMISGGYYQIPWEPGTPPVFLCVAWVNAGSTQYLATCDGLFTATTPAVSSLNAAQPSVMPWNTIVSHHGGSGLGFNWSYNPMLGGGPLVAEWGSGSSQVYNLTTYDHTKPIELQFNPAVWQPNRQIPLGFTILDSNGNFETAIGAGLTGAGQPAWPGAVGQQTQELVTYEGVSGQKGVNWQLTKAPAAANKIVPAAASVLDADTGLPLKVPRYPVYWSGETTAALKPPISMLDTEVTIFGTGSQWNGSDALTGYKGWNYGNKAQGWWIYSLRLNRYGTPGPNGVMLPQSSQITAQVGCMRNGSFVSFGTFNTGQNYNMLWPIFTSDALVYQASERLEVQAVAIATGNAGVTTGPNVQSPICAAHYLDTQALLNLIT
jgi:hypothetical protein